MASSPSLPPGHSDTGQRRLHQIGLDRAPSTHKPGQHSRRRDRLGVRSSAATADRGPTRQLHGEYRIDALDCEVDRSDRWPAGQQRGSAVGCSPGGQPNDRPTSQVQVHAPAPTLLDGPCIEQHPSAIRHPSSRLRAASLDSSVSASRLQRGRSVASTRAPLRHDLKDMSGGLHVAAFVRQRTLNYRRTAVDPAVMLSDRRRRRSEQTGTVTSITPRILRMRSRPDILTMSGPSSARGEAWEPLSDARLALSNDRCAAAARCTVVDERGTFWCSTPGPSEHRAGRALHLLGGRSFGWPPGVSTPPPIRGCCPAGQRSDSVPTYSRGINAVLGPVQLPRWPAISVGGALRTASGRASWMLTRLWVLGARRGRSVSRRCPVSEWPGRQSWDCSPSRAPWYAR